MKNSSKYSRKFTLILLMIGMVTSQVGKSLASDSSLTAEIRQNFKNPPSDCWPHTRWWWPGNPVSKETITQQLEQMKAHGITGVEQITMGEVYEKGNIPYLSDKFLEMLKHMVKEAKRLEMEVSLNFGGPGWIIGGEWVPDEERSKDIVPTSILLDGPRQFSGNLPDSLTRTRRSWEIFKPKLDGTEKLLAVVAGRVVENVLQENSLVVLTEFLKNRRITWEVPAGQWRLMAFWLKRNDHDHAVDHFSTKAMQNYCNYLGGEFSKTFGKEFGKTVESMFIDSFELPNSASGIYWSDDLLEKFKDYKGYDLTSYLPAIWWTVGEISPKIRYDVNDFLHHIGLEVFYKEFVGWCNRNNLKARIQTYGFTTDNIESAGRTDIPELEITPGEKDAVEWFDTRIGPKKYVSSGAHLYGRDVVSVEAYTFIHWERYRATLEEVKIASDGFLRAGATKFYNVGFSFSPEKELAPSRKLPWAVDISPGNIWWDYYPLLAEYIARSSYLLRQGDFVADIAVYSPLANQWTRDVLNARKWTREFDWGGLGDLLMSNGYDFDLLNDDILKYTAKIEEGMIKIQGITYKILILPNIQSLPLETLKFIQAYVKAGGVVLALEQVPDFATGFKNHQRNDDQVKKIVNEMFKEPFAEDEVGTVRYGNGKTHFIKMVLDRSIWWDRRSSTLDPFLNTIRRHILPDMAIDFAYEGIRKNKGLSFLHRRTSNSDIYFVSNLQDRASDLPLTFRVKDKQPWQWDPYTGKISPIFIYEETATGIKVPLSLKPYESTIIVFESGWGNHIKYSDFKTIHELTENTFTAESDKNGKINTIISLSDHQTTHTSIVSDIPSVFEIGGEWQLH